MDELEINGASDDLIEIKASAFRDEEFNVHLNTPADSLILAVSDGTLLRVRYDEDGVWRFDPIVVGCASVNIIKNYEIDDYSDRIFMIGEGLNWVALATHVAK